MKIVETKAGLTALINGLKKQGKFIGFVPTMGSLHEGHLSLIKKSKEQCDITVVSIFVNPTQFNNPEDLEKYPRDIKKDKTMLLSEACDILFYPEVKEIYPEPDKRLFKFGDLETVMEGKYRPGHFNGVAQVVSKFFDLVQPNKAFFGEKDFQQLAIVKRLVEQKNYDIQIISCPIIREDNGLAMSSRNARLNADQRNQAAVISETLFQARKMFQKGTNIPDIKSWANNKLSASEGLETEYFEIVDSETLKPISQITDNKHITACVAVHVGDVRLIDNVTFF